MGAGPDDARAIVTPADHSGCWRVGVLATGLAAASVPIYIHLPRFAVAELGLTLGQVGAILFLIRLVDFVQDPVLGWIADRAVAWRGVQAACALTGLAGGLVAVFSLPPPVVPVVWLVAGLLVIFTAYSMGMILLYGQSANFAGDGGHRAQMRLAGWREMGVLLGATIGAIGPTLLAGPFPTRGGYAAFGWMLGALALAAMVVARPLWARAQITTRRLEWAGLVRSGAGWLLVLAFINALPVAVTSTLFVFFVDQRLELPGLAGVFLVVFFIAGGLSAPLWGRLANRFGARAMLTISMSLSIAVFLWAFALPPGAVLSFAAISIGSGLALGADTVILSGLFVTALARGRMQAGQAFGLWNFFSKASLALAAGVMLPLMQVYGFRPEAANTPGALAALNVGYAIVPCALKIAAIVMVRMLPRHLFATCP